MKEITLKTDADLSVNGVTVNTVTLGEDANGFIVKRRFIPNIPQTDMVNKTFTIQYEEWRIPQDGKVYAELYTIKNYVICNNYDLNILLFDQWFSVVGSILCPAVENTINNLQKIPLDAPSGWVVNGSNQ